MRPGKIVCIGWNYCSHVSELRSKLPEVPTVFLKPSSCLIGDGDDILPSVSGDVVVDTCEQGIGET